MVGEGPADQRTKQEADRVAEQIADAARGGADRAAEADRRIELGRRDADARGGRGQPPFGRADVGPAGEQLRRRRRPGSAGRAAGMWFARPPFGAARRARVRSASPAGTVRCRARRRWPESRPVAGCAARRSAPCRAGWSAPTSTRRSVSSSDWSSSVDDAPGDRQPLGGAGGVGIGARGFGDDRDPDRVGIGLGGANIAARRLDAAADPAEQVDLIGDVDRPASKLVDASRSRLARGRGSRRH